MASIGAVTKQIAALEISAKKHNQTSHPGHTKQPSQTNVAKLLTKYAAPNPPTAKPTQPSSLRNPANVNAPAQTSKATAPSEPKPLLDIGKYDGGLELDNEKRGEKVFGEAAEALALDSSVSRCVKRALAIIPPSTSP